VLGKAAIHKKPSVDEQIASAEALMELMETNKSLVQHFVKKKFSSYHRGAEHEDIHSEGMLGMMESLLYYSPSISKLSTFVAPYIKGAISNYISKKNFGTMHYQMRNKQYNTALDSLQLQGITNPTMTQLAEEMGVGLDAVQRFMSVLQSANAVEMDREEVNEVEDKMSLRPDEYVIMKERADVLGNALDSLPEDQRIVIRMLFFTQDGKQSSYTAISKRLAEYYNEIEAETQQQVSEVNKQRIKQLRSKGMKKLRENVSRHWSDSENTLASKFSKIGFFPQPDIEEEESYLDQFYDGELDFGNVAV
jgi:RNA polymerase sigma factor for flagellar operon FliA